MTKKIGELAEIIKHRCDHATLLDCQTLTCDECKAKGIVEAGYSKHPQPRKCPRCGATKLAVRQRYCNHSAFNGYRKTPSDYSTVVCSECGWPWRTKANYVRELPDEGD